jgi:predicted ABC-type transport system involved in lysophospholipase L1 biosynthesis ATPase subunit
MRVVRYGARILEASVGFVKGMLEILTRFMQAVNRYKAVAIRGVVGGVKQGTLQMCLAGTAERGTEAERACG